MVITRIRGRLNYEQIGKVKTIFRKFDSDGSDCLEASEMKRLLLHFDIYLSDYEIAELLTAMDDDASGLIEFRELVEWFPTILALKRMGQFKPPSVEGRRQAEEMRRQSLNPNDGTKGGGGGTASASAANDFGYKLGLPGSGTTNVKTRSLVDWAEVRSKLPFAKDDPAEAARRKDLFLRFDMNGNGFLSLAEIDKGIRDEIRLPAMFNAKPVIMRAYQSSRSASSSAAGGVGGSKSTTSKITTINSLRNNNTLKTNTTGIKKSSNLSDDFVEMSEFRLLLKYLYGYFQLWECFEQIDTDGDRRIDLAEFTVGFQSLVAWGMCYPNEDPRALFKAIDLNGGGHILFDEMAAWALKRQLFNDS